MIEYLFAFAAGLLTVLSPCVLPAIPLVVGSALQKHKAGPLAVAAGLILSFVIVGVSLAASGTLLGIPEDLIRTAAAIILIIFGFALLSGRLGSRITKLFEPVSRAADKILRRFGKEGLAGQFLVGLLLGAVWSPCSGPTLGSAVGLAASGDLSHATLVMLLFGIGASIPLVLIAYGARSMIMKKRGGILSAASTAKKMLGVILLVVGIFIITGADKMLEAWFIQGMPEWLVDIITRY